MSLAPGYTLSAPPRPTSSRQAAAPPTHREFAGEFRADRGHFTFPGSWNEKRIRGGGSQPEGPSQGFPSRAPRNPREMGGDPARAAPTELWILRGSIRASPRRGSQPGAVLSAPQLQGELQPPCSAPGLRLEPTEGKRAGHPEVRPGASLQRTPCPRVHRALSARTSPGLPSHRSISAA